MSGGKEIMYEREPGVLFLSVASAPGLFLSFLSLLLKANIWMKREAQNLIAC